MPSDVSQNSFEASNVKVSTAVPSTCTDSVKGTYVNLMGQSNHYVLDNEDTQYFSQCTGQIIPALTGYLDYNRKVNTIPYSYNAKDKVNIELAELIRQGYLAKELNKNVATETVLRKFELALSDAETVFTQQPALSFLQKSIISLKSAIDTYRISFSDSNQSIVADMTYLIQNSSFETGTSKGWEIEKYGTELSTSVVNITNNLTNYMSGADGTYLYSAAGTASGGSIICQLLNGLPLGRYRIKALVSTEPGYKITLLINENETEVMPSELGSFYLTEGVTPGVEVTDGTLRIGAKCNGKWYKADHFRLEFLGMPTKIEDAQTTAEQIQITTGKGSITIRCNQPTAVSIYAINGQKIKKQTITDTGCISGLRTGLYIVNGKKVIVP